MYVLVTPDSDGNTVVMQAPTLEKLSQEFMDMMPDNVEDIEQYMEHIIDEPLFDVMQFFEIRNDRLVAIQVNIRRTITFSE